MNVSKTRPTTTNTTLLLLPTLSMLLTLSLILTLYHKDKLAITKWWPLSWAGLVVLALALAVVVAAARATMVTWITVLVLLAFAGNRRRVLVKRGRTITNDVAMFLAGVLVKERPGLVAVACATVFSVMAVIGIKESQLISLYERNQ